MARGPRALLVAVGLCVTGLALLVPVFVALGPYTLGLFMGGALLTVTGVLVLGLLLPRLLRRDRRE